MDVHKGLLWTSIKVKGFYGRTSINPFYGFKKEKLIKVDFLI